MITEIEVKLLEKSEELLFLRGVCMKIGLRTVKTAISRISNDYCGKTGITLCPSAGIISVLSVTSTKNICHDRNLSFVILSFSNYFSVYLFYFLGFTAIAFGIFCYYLFQRLCIFNYLMGLL